MEEKKPVVPSIEIVTEFDRALGKYTKRLFVGIAIMVLLFLAVEFTLIFFFLNDRAVLRTQTANGALIGGGGLAIIAFSSAYFLWPTKLMGWEALKITREMREKSDGAVSEMKAAAQNMNAFVAKAEPMLEKLKVEELKLTFELKMDQLIEKVDGLSPNDPVDEDAAREAAEIFAKRERAAKMQETP